jgi:hypothetical protein
VEPATKTVEPPAPAVRDTTKILTDFFERVAWSDSILDIRCAAGVALDELQGRPAEPYPDAA